MEDRDLFADYLAASEGLGDAVPERLGPYEDPRVAEVEQTSFACPDAYSGRLHDGRLFHFRYRHGHVSLEVGWDLNRADSRVGQSLGDALQGVFDSTEQRNEVFSRLLDAIGDT